MLNLTAPFPGKPVSLKRRILASGLLLTVLSVSLAALMVSRFLRADMERVLGDQQVATVSIVGAEIAAGFKMRTDALQLLAKRIDAPMLQQPQQLSQLLAQRQVLKLLFNAGVFVTDAAGLGVSDMPSIGRTGVSYIDRDFIAIALREGRVAVGKPVIGKRLQAPSISIAVPIRDAQGQVIGAIAGVTDLSRPNFLDSFSASHYGRSGGYLIVDPKHRLFVTATANNRRLVMQALPALGVNAVLDRRLQGFDGSAVNVNSLGFEVLTASARIPVPGWFVIATLPTAEAFAPIHAMERNTLFVALAVILVAGSLMWWRLQRLMSPLEAAAHQVAALNAEGTTPKALPVAADDEVGELIGGFNRMLAVAAEREGELRVSGAVLQNMQEGVGLIQADTGRIVFTNPKFDALFGYPTGSMLGLPVSELNAPSDIDPQQLAEQIMGELNRTGRWHGAIENRRQDGTRFWCQVAVSTLMHQTHGRVWVAVHQDITERVDALNRLSEANRLLESLASHDALTGLFNRRGVNQMAERALADAQREGNCLSVVMLDIDHFKRINDAHGHPAGDAVISAIGHLLLQACRSSDTAARYGGEEFLLLLPRASALDAQRRAEDIRAAVQALVMSHGAQVLSTTVSLGIATFPQHGGTLDALLESADRAMYAAKRAGRNQVQLAPAD